MHEDFKIFHCEVDQLLLGVERPIINNLLKDHPYSLFLFSDSNNSTWHLINVKYDEEETRRKLFRRIVVGPDERLHTAAQRITLLEIPDARTLSPLELQQQHDQAFDVEAVTKEYFNSFVQMFHLLREEIEELNPMYKAKAAEFSQILLNRLMFLYFIQKKGWLDGNTSYLYERYRKVYNDLQTKHTYYTEVLLLIFKKLANVDLQFKQLGSIPFLNGGLFESEPWENVLKISNGLFGKLFKDLFEHYNFTVREDTAMDMEVAIDPEMLGKVFENLILQLEKDPSTDLRKATGSYYTPRVIVHFMSQQSLKEYLIENLIPSVTLNLVQCLSSDTSTQITNQVRNDGKGLGMGAEKQQICEKIEKLFTLNPASQLTIEEVSWLKSSFTHDEAERMKNLILSCRVCDPAVGSGAFVVGMLHEMVAIIKLLDVLLKGAGEIQKRNYDYELKRKIIEYCLYGVDIQEQAVRICELRLWLSLVVDYQGKDIPPLPNLSYRIRQGNSLIDKLFGYPVNLNISQVTEKGEKLKQLIDSIQNDKDAYFYESEIQKKHKSQLGILAKQCDLSTLYLKLRLDIVLAEYESKYSEGLFGYKKLRKAERDEEETLQNEINELERLILLAKNTNEKLLAVEKRQLPETEKTRRLLNTFVWNIDFAEVFKENNGFDITMANPPYIDSERMTKTDKSLRDLVQSTYTFTRGNWDIYIAFYERGLNILNNRGVLSFITPDKWISKPFGDTMRIKTTDNIFSILNAGRDLFESVNVDAIVSLYTKTPQSSLRIYDYIDTEIKPKRIIQKDTLKPPYAYDWLFSNYVELLEKIEGQTNKLSSLGICENACATSDAYKLRDLIQEASGKSPSNDYLRIINTGTIGKYISKWGKREMVYLGNRYTRPVVNKKQFQITFRNSYSKKAVRQKLILKGLNLLDACIDADGTIIPGKTTLLITCESLDKLKLILSLVNSNLAFFYLKERYPASSYNQGTTFTKEMINNFPIPELRADDRAKLVSIVDCILAAKDGNPDVDTTKWEREINELLYELYDFTEEDIKVVESKKKR